MLQSEDANQPKANFSKLSCNRLAYSSFEFGYWDEQSACSPVIGNLEAKLSLQSIKCYWASGSSGHSCMMVSFN